VVRPVDDAGGFRADLTIMRLDGTWYRQQENYYVVRVGHVRVSLAGLDDIEHRTVTGYRWWSHEELAATAEPFYPVELLDLVRRLASGSGSLRGRC
jgi:hypothetical protein